MEDEVHDRPGVRLTDALFKALKRGAVETVLFTGATLPGLGFVRGKLAQAAPEQVRVQLDGRKVQRRLGCQNRRHRVGAAPQVSPVDAA